MYGVSLVDAHSHEIEQQSPVFSRKLGIVSCEVHVKGYVPIVSIELHRNNQDADNVFEYECTNLPPS